MLTIAGFATSADSGTVVTLGPFPAGTLVRQVSVQVARSGGSHFYAGVYAASASTPSRATAVAGGRSLVLASNLNVASDGVHEVTCRVGVMVDLPVSVVVEASAPFVAVCVREHEGNEAAWQGFAAVDIVLPPPPKPPRPLSRRKVGRR